MAADDFFSRWAKKTESVIPEVAKDKSHLEITPLPLPTLDDVAALNTSSDFSPFVAQGVDDIVKRLALKKLFSDPRFNIMDGLDTYIEDYNTFVPMTADMVAELNHAKLLMDPLAHLEKPFMQMLETPLPEVAVDEEKAIETIDDAADESDASGASDALDPPEGEQLMDDEATADDVAIIAETDTAPTPDSTSDGTLQLAPVNPAPDILR